MKKFYVTGGRQNEGATALYDHFCYGEARILSFDESGRVEECATYRTPDEFRPSDPRSNIVFKAASLHDGQFVVCTQTEILVYSLPDFQIVHHVSHPWLNDAHHVTRNAAGNFLVANTGLDQVLELDQAGRHVGDWSTLPDQDTWDRFDRDTDYRKVATTKPHQSHPNYVLEYKGDLWVSRFYQRDLFCLSDGQRRIEIGIQSVHDGNLVGDRTYMTTVDGHVLVLDMIECRILEDHDLNQIIQNDKTLGWCRGIHILDEDRVLVGFSRIRPSKIRENLRWVKYKMGMREDGGRLPTCVVCVNLRKGQVEYEVDLEAHGLNAVFSILPAD